MPSGKHWVHFIYINIAFAVYIAGVFYYNQMEEIKNKWPEYRCNPMYMMMADNIEENFIYCIQNIQTGFMGYLLEPLTYITNNLTTQMGGFMGDIQNIRAMFHKVRTFFSSILETVFGVFLNLIIEFQRITIGMRDLIGKTVGIMVSLMYVMDGSVKTMNSTWNGPPGQMVRALGKCFSPHTKIRMLDGRVKCMKDVDIGEQLEDGSYVEATMKIDNRPFQIPYYMVPNGVNRENIMVTGSHLIYDKHAGKFIETRRHPEALATEECGDWFVCFITNSHQIRLGEQVFWDWEDHFVKMNFSKQPKRKGPD